MPTTLWINQAVEENLFEIKSVSKILFVLRLVLQLCTYQNLIFDESKKSCLWLNLLIEIEGGKNLINACRAESKIFLIFKKFGSLEIFLDSNNSCFCYLRKNQKLIYYIKSVNLESKIIGHEVVFTEYFHNFIFFFAFVLLISWNEAVNLFLALRKEIKN